MPDNQDLRRQLSLARKREMFFAFSFKGGQTSMLVSKKPIKPGEFKETRTETGGKAAAGSCQFQDGYLVLKVERGVDSSQLPRLMRRHIKDATGFSWKVRLADGSAEDSDGDANDADDND
jgi:hypothetical protein